eukprot:329673-Prorocentrum_lima.AAC.1
MSFANGQKSLLKWSVVIHFPTLPEVQAVVERYARDKWHSDSLVIPADATSGVLAESHTGHDD